jgi:hypothetical protein
MTGIGCALDYVRSRKLPVDGIAVVSDGGENCSPAFAHVYKQYCEQLSKEPTVYLLHVPGDPDQLSRNCESAGVTLEKLELGTKTDYNSLPNIVGMMRTNRYSLYDEVMAVPLLDFQTVFAKFTQSERKGKSATV